ncbi:MAG: hypothetical protein HQ592_04280, partial [Planctomycetes bacterium]|nr:hypothetical protein [Planctomycetota bacterium]
MKLRPAPGRVVVDGKLDDWDLTGGIFAVNDVENLRDEYGAWFHAMYDEKNVYLLARWNDPTPLNNPGSSKGDMGFQGDCLQVRFITACETPQERVTHWTCWRDRDGLDLMDMACGREFNEGGLRDAKMKGARQMFAVYDDRKGYMQEMSIPWSLLTKDGAPLKPGDQPRMTLEPNYTAGAFGRVTIKDIFKEGIVPDRVFTFRAYGHWGTATLEKAGNQQPRPIRLSDGREFPVSMEKGLPVVNWAGLIKTEEMPGFMPIRFTMPADGYVSLNILDKDGVVVRQLLTCAFYTKGEHEVKWDGLATPYWRKPGSPVEPGEYSWKAIMHTGIGLRLRGWASNGGNAPWDSSLTSNWGGDHGVPIACTTDGEKVYLGWSGAEAGKALVACDLEANVAWKHTHGGMGGAQLVAVDGGIVYVASGPSLIYRVDTVRGTYSAWKGKETATIQVNAIWADPAGMPVRIEGMDAKNGKLYVTCSAATLNRGDVKDWRSLLQRIYTGDGLARSIHAKLREHSRNRLAWWFDANPDATEEDACKSPNYYTPDVRDDAVNVLNGLLDDTGLVPGGATLSADRLAQANRTLIEKTFAGLFAPMKTNFLAVLDGQTGKARKLIDVEVPRSVRAVSDTLVYVVSDRSSVLAVDPNAGAVRAVVTGLQNAAGVAVDDNGRIYVSVQDPDHQVKIFSPDGRPAGEIGRKGGRPEMGPWVRNAMRKPVGVVVDKAGKLWVMETTSNPKRISVWDAKSGKFLKELFGPTHYGASGGAINPRDPNI